MKYFSSQICPYMTNIINCCIEGGYFSMAWKYSVISPPPKSKKSENYNDLGPVNILHASSKVMKIVIYQDLYKHVKNNKILPDNKSEFRKGFGTTSNVINIIDNVLSGPDLGLVTAMILLDCSEAFGTLNQSLLLAKLRYYGCHNLTIKFFAKIFDGHQQVQIEGNTSELGIVKSCVPQGSVRRRYPINHKVQ